MEYILLLMGLAAGLAIGYLLSARRTAALKAEVVGARQREEMLKLQTAAGMERERAGAEERIATQERHFNERLADQKRQWEERMNEQKEEVESLHKRLNLEFENLSNRIFQSKTEDFKRLNAEHLNQLLRPLDDNLKAFREKVELAYSTEAKELVELNTRLGEEANNLTRALRGDSKAQGNWGEMILERLLQASGLIEGEHYFRQEFL